MHHSKKPCPLKQVEKGIAIDLPQDLYDEIMYLVDKSPIEISGLGKCKFEDGVFKVLSLYLPSQENTSTSTDLDSDSVGKIEFESMKDEGHLNFWWHSHVNMGAFWSGTDTDTIEEYGRSGFCLATVFNKRGQTRSAYYQGSDGFLPSVFIDDMKLNIVGEEVKANERLDKLYTERCRRPKHINTHTGPNYLNSGSGNGNWASNQVDVPTKYELAEANTKAHVARVLYQWRRDVKGDFSVFAFIIFKDETYRYVGAYQSKIEAKQAYNRWKEARKLNKGAKAKVTLSAEQAARADGAIHKTVHNLRWHKESGSYRDYEKFATDDELWNELDYSGLREEVISSYFLQNPEAEDITDKMINDAWMKANGYKKQEFYFGAFD